MDVSIIHCTVSPLSRSLSRKREREAGRVARCIGQTFRWHTACVAKPVLHPLSLGLCFASSVPLSPVNGREKQFASRKEKWRGRMVFFFPLPFTGEGGRLAGRGEAVP